MVCIDNIFSDAGTINYGVPQVPILVSLLFLIYVNELSNHYQRVVPIWMQITLAFSTSMRTLKNIKIVLTEERSSLYQWFIENKLSINFGEDKTKFILFSKA